MKVADLSPVADATALRIVSTADQAASAAQLKQAAVLIDDLVLQLHAAGTPARRIAHLVCELNARVFARLWALLAPPAVAGESCLIVMGSEGRGEQILKTDQDNALLLADGADPLALQGVAQQFIDALIDFGYPRCPGDIMLSNPLWRQPLAGFKETLVAWMFGADPQGPMNLAIFLDAAAVAGDATLLAQARQFVQDHVVDNDAFFARFARAADQFNEPGGWWRWLGWPGSHDESPFDLKKLGTFPIVHGVRALALQHHIVAAPTADRLRALVDGQHLAAQDATQLADALNLLMDLKLHNNLRQRARGEALSNLLPLHSLDDARRTELQAALAVIKRFRQYLRLHFRLDVL
jgi:CBS domain-containing protein